jgi:putative endonuclease
MAYSFHVYIITNSTKSVLYTGFTNDLPQRLTEHYLNKGTTNSFTGKYHCYYLLYQEHHQYVNNAIAREKEIKGWIRTKKLDLIKSVNPRLKFLNKDVMEWPPAYLYHR